ncbi:MAG: UvrD-helicase domain-containing protein [Gammaproteobacteria bacterium]|nr:UvrD-helicase domain-containing protein [Gammaproteobacteria bacterium]
MRSLKGDAVKSFEELEIANFLYTKGIPYEYEVNYIKDTSGPDYRVYQPDFHLTEDDIYLEHFAIDRDANTPPFIDGVKYRQGIDWKRQLHQKHQTRLIETYSYENKEGVLLENLENKLIENQVKFKPINCDELFEELKELGEISIWSKLMADLLNIFKSAFSSINEVIEIAKTHTDHIRMIVAIELFEPIYEKYQAYLDETKSIDFDDMISKAIQYIETGRYKSPFQFVLVDEFQDISASRAHLLKSLLAQNKFNSLFCVGDDWQSINRFSGSDVSITKKFQDYFGQTEQNILETTFRFNNKIGDVAARFITKNPHQINKDIQSFHTVEHESVSIIQTDSDQQGLDIALSSIAQKSKDKASVLVLARFNFKKPEMFNRLIKNFSNLDVQFMSVHASKGKEADYVIILGMEKGKHGFPSEKVTHPILNMLLPKAENFKYAEERRLFYVALTRARNYVYLVSNAQKSSSFIRELKKGSYAVLTDEFKGAQVQEDTEEVSCPTCKNGYLVSRNGAYGDFHACSNYPYCDYKQQVCKKCGSLRRKIDRFLICTNDKCLYIDPICPSCGGVMQLRNGRHSKFWGCSNYRRNTDFPCTHTEKYIDLNLNNIKNH